MTGYPRGFETVLWTLAAALVVTGLLLVPGAMELRWDWAMPWRLPPGSGVGAAAIHGIAASAFTALFGALWVVHLRSGWRKRRHLASGLAGAGSLVLLIVTGWGIYYAGERTGAWASAIHVGVGILAAGVIAVHVLRGKSDG